MEIHFKKNVDKLTTIHCIRDDGSSTWTPVSQGLELHDLAHFAVENELKLKESFYGQVASGVNITDYTLPREIRPKNVLPKNLPEESIQVEHIVNLLQVGFGNDQFDLTQELKEVLNDKELDFPSFLTEESILQINNTLKKLMNQWTAIEAGESLILKWNH